MTRFSPSTKQICQNTKHTCLPAEKIHIKEIIDKFETSIEHDDKLIPAIHAQCQHIFRRGNKKSHVNKGKSNLTSPKHHKMELTQILVQQHFKIANLKEDCGPV